MLFVKYSQENQISPSKYRADIDGLRALAVIAVLLFHYHVPGFTGGFVGVDIFFVISGYLITGILLEDIRRDRFSLAGFFRRRARRLLPALFAVSAVTFAVAAFLFSPELLRLTGQSVVAAVLSVSNILFWWEADYFDAASEFKPLLHTWSLGVEWQFYLVWPFVVLFLARCGRDARWYGLVFIALATIAAELAMLRYPEAAFYLTPFRFGEFAVGALLWFLPAAPRYVADIGFSVGLIAIAASIHLFDSTTPFPGVSALIPCIGTFLMMWSSSSRLVGLTGNPVMSWIGRISYSVYLIHWPLLVFVLYSGEGLPSPVETALLLLASFLLGWLSYVFVEQPFRRPPSGGRKILHVRDFARYAAFPLALCLVAGHAGATDGWLWRIPPEIRSFFANLDQKQRESSRFEAEYEKPFTDSGKTRVVIIGDSHSTDVFNAVYYHRDSYPDVEFRRLYLADFCLFVVLDLPAPSDMAASRVERCRTEVAHTLESDVMKHADILLYSTRWRPESLKNLDAFAAWARRNNKKLVLLGRTAEFEHVPNLAMQYARISGLDEYVTAHRDKTIDDLNARLRKKAESLGLIYLDKASMICDRNPDRCTVVDEKNNLLIVDYGHWSLQGADFYGRRMVERNFFAPAFAK